MNDVREIFDSVVVQITDVFRSEGYKRRGLTFFRETADGWQLAQIQKSVANDRSQLRFTLNLGVFSSRLGKVRGTRRSTRVPVIADCDWSTRIGHVMPIRDDWWWELRVRSE